jgi:hypothetical protein
VQCKVYKAPLLVVRTLTYLVTQVPFFESRFQNTSINLPLRPSLEMMQFLDKPTTDCNDLAHLGSWTGAPERKIHTQLKATGNVLNHERAEYTLLT